MLIGLETELKYRKRGVEEGRPQKAATLAVINGKMDFTKTDGHIQFIGLVLRNIPKAYGKQSEKWMTYINRIYSEAEALQDANVRFTGKTREDFRNYCNRISQVFKEPVNTHLPGITLDITTSSDLISFIQKHIDKGNRSCFYYEEEENIKKEIMNDLMNQLNGAKFSKPSRDDLDISYYLRSSKYHEHVHDALEIIKNAAVYAVNCSSTKEKEAFSFDTQEIHNRLLYAESIIERAKHLV